MKRAIFSNERLGKQMLVCIWLCFVCGMFASQFVVYGPQKQQSKTAKPPSKSKLQEMCCQEIVGILRELPLLLKDIADMQQEGMKEVCAFVEGDSACKLKQIDGPALQQTHAELVSISESIKGMHQKCHQYARKISSLR